MRKIIKFAYNGKNFFGFARQPNLRTVEGELLNVLIKNGFIKNASDSFFRSASRTDKGVSALANVVAFNTDCSNDIILKKLLDEPSDIFVYGVLDVDSSFNPRYAKMRQYRYYLLKKDLDVEKIITASACFTGEHDFSNFAKIEKFRNPVRTIENIVISEDKYFLVFDFFAQNYLWNQIRRITSALIKIGKHSINKKDILDGLCNPDKVVDFGLASAEPLILKEIFYDFKFNIDKYFFKKLDALENQIISNLY
jgi:tRNA pseudouridine38-40 synthase